MVTRISTSRVRRLMQLLTESLDSYDANKPVLDKCQTDTLALGTCVMRLYAEFAAEELKGKP
jgi:hypothetical protein